MHAVAIAMGWVLTVIVGAFGFVIIWKMFSGKIDLSKLISEENGDASMSRFQFLIFTFVIALSLFVVSVGAETPGFPKIPSEIFVLLGISGGSYLISKGVQKATGTSPTPRTTPPAPGNP